MRHIFVPHPPSGGLVRVGSPANLHGVFAPNNAHRIGRCQKKKAGAGFMVENTSLVWHALDCQVRRPRSVCGRWQLSAKNSVRSSLPFVASKEATAGYEGARYASENPALPSGRPGSTGAMCSQGGIHEERRYRTTPECV